MSTEQQNRPDSRPSPDSVRQKTPILESLKNNTKSIRQALALVGVGAVVFGVLIWIFLRGLEGPAFVVAGVGFALLLVDAIISLATV